MTVTITHHTASSTTSVLLGERPVHTGPEPDGVAGAERTAEFCRLLGDTVVLVVVP